MNAALTTHAYTVCADWRTTRKHVTVKVQLSAVNCAKVVSFVSLISKVGFRHTCRVPGDYVPLNGKQRLYVGG